MRKIKFRAFLEKEKQMIKVENIDFFEDGNIGILFKKENGFYELKTKEFKLMQYTGLEDINGKEIYEGDILEYDDEFFKVEYHCDCFLACPFGISFEDDDFPRFPIGSLASHGNINYDCGYAKVIGNIYENPELI